MKKKAILKNVVKTLTGSLITKHLLQLPLTSLRTYDLTHSRFVTRFRILKKSKSKSFNFFIYCTN